MASNSAVIRAARKKANVRAVENDLGLPEMSSAAAAEAHARRLVGEFRDVLPQMADDADDKERWPADDLIPMAVSALVHAHALSADRATSPRLLLHVSHRTLFPWAFVSSI